MESGNLFRPVFFKIISGLILCLLFQSPFYPRFAGCLEKDDQSDIIVIGTGRILEGNTAAARKAAVSEALIKGVEEYLTRYLGSQGMINNFPRIIREVIPQSGDEIENFHILAEDKGEHQYKILVRVKVNEKLMEEKLRKLGMLLMEGPPIKILFMVSQKIGSHEKESYWWADPEGNTVLTTTELVLHRVFQERGFSPVNRMQSVPEEKLNPDMMRPDLTEEDAAAWGELFASDVVILGKSRIMEGQSVSLDLKAVDVKTRAVIAQDSLMEPIASDLVTMDLILETLERIVNRTGARLGPEIIKFFEETEEETNIIDIELRGLKGFDQFRAFRDFLQNKMGGVTSVIQKRIKGDSITVAVEFTGKKDAFINKLMGYERFPFRAIVSRTEEGIVLEIK